MAGFPHPRDVHPVADPSKPHVLIVNDDQHLLNTRRMLLEHCGAQVSTARGVREAICEALTEPADLVLIDATNVGLAHGEMLCALVKSIHPTQCVVLLITPEMGLPSKTEADRIIQRTGPRRILVEINEMLKGRLAVDLWESPYAGPSSAS